jgi:hypothetical protein
MFSAYSPASASDFGTLSVLVFTVACVLAGAVLTFDPALFAFAPPGDADEHPFNPIIKSGISKTPVARNTSPTPSGLVLSPAFIL